MTRPRLDEQRHLADTVCGWVAEPAPDRVRRDTAGWRATHWRAAAGAARVLGVAPLLHQLLERRGALASVDPVLADVLAACHASCRARAPARAAEVRRVLALGTLLDVKLVLVGDTALALHCAGDVIAPPGIETHLLIRPAEEARFTAALGRSGWVGIVRRVSPTRAVFAEHQCDAPLDGDDVAHLRLHTSLDYYHGDVRFDLTWAYWYEARTRLVEGVPALVPSPLRLLQYLLARASERLMTLELSLADLWNLRVVATGLGSADWRTLVEEAVNQGEARIAWAPLRLAERSLGGRVAAPAKLAELRAQVPAALREWVEAASAADWAARRFDPERPVEWTRWCRSPWERTLAVRRMLLPLPHELGTSSVARGYVRHLRRLAAHLPWILHEPVHAAAAAPLSPRAGQPEDPDVIDAYSSAAAPAPRPRASRPRAPRTSRAPSPPARRSRPSAAPKHAGSRAPADEHAGHQRHHSH